MRASALAPAASPSRQTCPSKIETRAASGWYSCFGTFCQLAPVGAEEIGDQGAKAA